MKTVTFVGGTRDGHATNIDDDCGDGTPIDGSLPWRVLDNGMVQRYERYIVRGQQAVFECVLASNPGKACNSPADATPIIVGQQDRFGNEML